jgi:guanylate kinase
MIRSIDSVGKLLITCGLSGSGKSTLVRRALNAYPDKLDYMNTLTTRPRRENEDDVEYTFVTHEEYNQAKYQSSSWDESVIYGNYYGLSPDKYIDIMNNGKSLMLCSIPSNDIIENMARIYGRERIETIHLMTPLALAAERLIDRDISMEIGRLAIDKELTPPDGSINFQSDFVFEPSGALQKDMVRFANLVGGILNG